MKCNLRKYSLITCWLYKNHNPHIYCKQWRCGKHRIWLSTQDENRKIRTPV